MAGNKNSSSHGTLPKPDHTTSQNPLQSHSNKLFQRLERASSSSQHRFDATTDARKAAGKEGCGDAKLSPRAT